MPGTAFDIYARDAFAGVCECANIQQMRATTLSDMEESQAAFLRADDLARHCA
jgi:hypothetical protein